MINKENLIGLCGILLAIIPQIVFYAFHDSSISLILRWSVCFVLAYTGARVFTDRKILAHKLDCKLRGLQRNCK